jgi:DNA-binding HxlR family transcriptional regulator
VRRTSLRDRNCSIAQCLEVTGDWWTLLILRDVFLGVHRFDDLQADLGISRNVLARRLDQLVDDDVLARHPYSDAPPRSEYVLTPKGRDLWPVLDAMRRWGDTWHAPAGPPVEVVHVGCGERTAVVPTCAACGEALTGEDLRAVPGPGADGSGPLARRERAGAP